MSLSLSTLLSQQNITANTNLVGVITSSQIANTTVAANTYGGSTYVPAITVDAQGRVSYAANVAITGGVSSVGGATGAVSNAQLAAGISTNGILDDALILQLLLSGM